MRKRRLSADSEGKSSVEAKEMTKWKCQRLDKRAYTIAEIQQMLGIGRSSAYELVKEEYFHSVKIGGMYRISKKSFDRWLDEGKEDWNE